MVCWHGIQEVVGSIPSSSTTKQCQGVTEKSVTPFCLVRPAGRTHLEV